ncbi:hypothetical protein ACOSQ4_021536 [Xanthoceras sorbifolium]
MGSKANFLVDTLKEEEARNLFMKIAGVGEEQPDLQSLAFQVAKKCEGLLVAIVTVANALKDKPDSEWRIALRELSNPPFLENVEGSVVNKAYGCIHLSYKRLESEELMSTFLLCCIMGCTDDVSIEVLLIYAVGLSLFHEENTIEEVRDKVRKMVRKLKDCSLLLGIPNGETFSIHDVIRDVGGPTINNVFPSRWVGENTLENCTSITLHDIAELSKPLRCPNLKFFYMKTVH